MNRFCLRCGKEFETHNPILVFCSQSCIKEEVNDKHLNGIAKRCRACSELFVDEQDKYVFMGDNGNFHTFHISCYLKKMKDKKIEKEMEQMKTIEKTERLEKDVDFCRKEIESIEQTYSVEIVSEVI